MGAKQGGLRPARIVLERRSIGLAPGLAESDDKPVEMQTRNREARVVSADADGLLTDITVPFGSAQIAQQVLASTGTGWGAATATLDWYPAFVDPSYDGLLVRITLHNTSSDAEVFAVDQLGGMCTTGDGFATKDLIAETESGSADVVIRHAAFKGALAIAAVAESPVRAFRVDDSYFGPDSNRSTRSPGGTVVPPGALSDNAQPDSGLWGLERVDDIHLAAGEQATIYFAVGSGADPNAARESAHHLLNATGVRGGQADTMFERAQRAHETAQWQCDNLALKRLMSQSLCNTPFETYRRVGVPTRSIPSDTTPLYDPESGGWMALGWGGMRPDRAAAQLNAWFLTNSDVEAPVKGPGAVVPSNLFALWELYQQTTDRAMLDKFYPYAVKRYRAFADAGRVGVDGAVYGWPVPGKSPEPSADYTAYVIRSAFILAAMADRLGKPAAEVEGFRHEAALAVAALNDSLYDAQAHTYKVGANSLAAGVLPTSRGMLPLICGPLSVPADRAGSLLAAIETHGMYSTVVGIRSELVPAEANVRGSVLFAQNWLLWKAMLDFGDTDAAQALADSLIAGYTDCVAKTDALPPRLDPGGRVQGFPWDYTGDSCCLLSLWESYHRAGNVTAGWNVELLDHRYDSANDGLHLVMKPLQGNSGKLLCVMGHANTDYKVTGEITTTLHSNANGLIVLSPGSASGTLQCDVALAGPAQ